MRFSFGCLIRRSAALTAALVGFGLWLAPGAWAQSPTPFQDIQSGGTLTNIYAGNDLSCQIATKNDSATEFFPGQSDLGDCGTFLQVNGDSVGGGLWGPDFSNHAAGSETGFSSGSGDYTAYTPVSQTGVTGSGTAQSPYQVTTVVTMSEPGPNSEVLSVKLTQVDSYVVGDDYYTSTVTVANQSNSISFSGRLFHAGDCYLRDFDTGYGALEPSSSSPTSAACTLNANNSPASALEDFVPVTDPGSAH